MIARAFPLVSALLVVLGIGGAHAQDRRWDAEQLHASRAELQALLERYEANAAASNYSGALRAQAAREARAIRARLEQGDFQVGDQIALVVEGEQPLTNSFTVQEGPALVLPAIGSISLAGVLRSELATHLATELRRYIRDPVVQARSSMRLVITGAVAKPGYHVVPADVVVSDLLMVADGPTSSADLAAMRIERAGERIWEGEALQQAIIEGRTLDRMGFRAGDEIVVPERRQDAGVWGGVVRPALAIVGPVVALITLLFR